MTCHRFFGNLPLALYLFLIIYTPALGPVPGLAKYFYLVGGPVIASFYLLARRTKYVGLGFGYRPLVVAMYCSILGSLYVAAVRLAGTAPVDSILDTRLLQNNSFTLLAINAILAVALLRERGFGRMASFEMLLVLGSIQGLFAIGGVLSPAIKAVSNALYAAAGGGNEFVIAARVYGFSTDFTYGTPIYHGTLAAIAFYFVLDGRRYYLIPTLLLLATTALNGRTGLLIFVVLAVALAISRLRKRGSFVSIFALATGAAVLGWGALRLLEKYVPSSYRFLSAFLSDTAVLINEGKLQGNYAILAEGLTARPQGLGLIFGEGVYLYSQESGFRTDVGVTIDLFAGGLVALLLVYGTFLAVIFGSKNAPIMVKFSLLVMWFFANIKGEFFRSSILLFLVLFLIVNWEVPLRSKTKLRKECSESKGDVAPRKSGKGIAVRPVAFAAANKTFGCSV